MDFFNSLSIRIPLAIIGGIFYGLFTQAMLIYVIPSYPIALVGGICVFLFYLSSRFLLLFSGINTPYYFKVKKVVSKRFNETTFFYQTAQWVVARLEYETAYRLDAVNLADEFGGAVVVPVTTFTTRDNTPPVINLDAIVFSMPDAEGLVRVTAPAGTLTPGTEVLVLNAGNGYVMSFTAENDGALGVLLPAIFPASISDLLMVTITDPSGNVTSFQRSQYVAPDGTISGIGPGGGTVKGPGGVELRIPSGAVERGVTLKLTGISAEELGALFPGQTPDLPGAQVGSGIKIESAEQPKFKKEADLAFPLPAGLPENPSDAFFWMKRAPMFEVMIRIAFLKFTRLPSPSVRWPSSDTCSLIDVVDQVDAFRESPHDRKVVHIADFNLLRVEHGASPAFEERKTDFQTHPYKRKANLSSIIVTRNSSKLFGLAADKIKNMEKYGLVYSLIGH